MSAPEAPSGLAELGEAARDLAWARWQVIAPAVEDGTALTTAAAAGGVALRTAQRWLARYRAGGLAGLARPPRSDHGQRRTHPELVALVEGLALVEPRLSVATITRRAAAVATVHGWVAPSYSTVRTIAGGIDPQLAALAHDGPGVWRDRFELALRRQAERPNDLWQADHTELDIEVLDADGTPARPWLTVILDDCSRAVAGYTVFLGAPSALNLSLALRQAIWTKTEPGWAVHGLPDVLYADHGSDFISHHLTQICVDLHIRLVHSAVGRPQGRGKIERFFGTVTTELLPALPGHLVRGRRASPPALTLPELDAAIGRWVTTDYHPRPHSETRQPPQQAWLADGWLPRTPDSLEALDLLLVMVAAGRVVHRDGIRFEGQRFHSPTLAPYVGQPVTIRYDPRDLGEVRVFHRDRFLTRAVNTDQAGHGVSLKDIHAARVAHRRALRHQLAAHRAAVAEYLPAPAALSLGPPVPVPKTSSGSAGGSTESLASPRKAPTTRVRPPGRSEPAALLLYQADLDPRSATVPDLDALDDLETDNDEDST